MNNDRVVWDDYGRVCNRCGDRLPWELFAINSHGANGRKSICKDCSNKAQKALYKSRSRRDPEGFREGQRYKEIWKKYKITKDEFERLERSQGYKCACCGKSKERGVNLVVDHCHESGGVRGLLCRNCNSGIGKLGDTKEGVFKALRYLEKFEGNMPHDE